MKEPHIQRRYEQGGAWHGFFYKGIITKLSDNKNLRTDSVEGFFDNLPKIGERFNMLSEPIKEKANFRLVSTSPVIEIIEEVSNTIIFKTHSGSKYYVEYNV